jgi:hypothetical protein
MLTNSTSLANTAIALALAACLGACEKPAATKAEEVNLAQATANQRSAEAQLEANQKANVAQQKANETIDKEQDKVALKVDNLAKDMTARRSDLRVSMEKSMASVDKRIIDITTKVKLAKTTKMPRESLNASLKDLQVRSDTLKKSSASVATATAESYDGIKASLDAEVTALGKSMDELEAKI